MNVTDIKNGLTQKFGRTGLKLQKHSPEILLAAGLVGMAATVVMASKATLKLEGVVGEAKNALNLLEENAKAAKEKGSSPEVVDEITLKSKAQVYAITGLELAKLYGPAIAVGGLSVAAIVSSHGVMAKRQASLMAAYALMAEAYNNYRKRVAEELGEEKDLQYHLGLREESYNVKELDEEGKTVKSKKKLLVPTGTMPSIYARCFDNSNPLYKSDRSLNAAYLAAQERYLNDVLILRGFVFLNEAYDRCGFPMTPEGQLVGWVLHSPEEMKEEGRDGYVSFGLGKYSANREFMAGTNDAIWLDFNVDGVIYDLIER